MPQDGSAPTGGEGGPADRPVVRLLVCDDHRILTETLALAVRSDPAFTLVTPPLSSPQEAIDAVGRLHPDVVLMDIGFSGDMDGIQATRRIKEVSPETAVIIVTAHPEDRLVLEARGAGASGFLSKTEGLSTVLAAARAAAGGELLFETEQLAELAARATRQRQPHAKMDQRLGRLTPREREVLSLLARGVRGEDVARTLFISPQTVQTHIRNILGKLQVRSRLEAAVLYAESFEGRSDPGAADETGR